MATVSTVWAKALLEINSSTIMKRKFFHLLWSGFIDCQFFSDSFREDR